jgi:hypothetical protein
MKIDAKELVQVAALQPPRFDMYGGIHKAVRAFMADTLVAVGRMDVDDAGEAAGTADRVMQLLDFCSAHLAHENQFVHAAIEARAPGASAAIAHDHEEHVQEIGALAAAVAALGRAQGPQRHALAQSLYRQLARFIAANLEHMHVEETAHNAVLWTHYTDEELVRIHDELVASIPPEQMMVTARWLVPFLSPVERAGLLADIRAKAPAPAFEALLGVSRPHLTRAEDAKLARALELA